MLRSTQSGFRRSRVHHGSVSLSDIISVSLKSTLVCVSVLVAVKALIVESFYIPSSSMEPTLERDDYIIVPKFAYGLHLPFLQSTIVSWSGPRHGEVVVFRRQDDLATTLDESLHTMVKRVVGLGGDTISIIGKHIYVNGSILSEPYARWVRGGFTKEQAFVVPEGAIFLLGDNRDESYDSRFWRDPFVSLDRVVGPVTAVYWSARLPERSWTWIR